MFYIILPLFVILAAVLIGWFKSENREEFDMTAGLLNSEFGISFIIWIIGILIAVVSAFHF